MSDWQQVWECPKCGTQIAGGLRGPRETPVDLSNLKCSMGHKPTEMEQKLVRAMEVKPEAFDL